MKILYAEDELSMAEAVSDILIYHKYTVDTVFDGKEALAYALSEQYDLIILDIMMPEMDGLEVLKELRKREYATPIMLLTAKSEISDQVGGLNMGADDYLPKPFSMELLLAHVRALLRRKENFVPNLLMFGDLSLNQQSYVLSCGTENIILPKLEFQLMELFLINKGIFLSTEDILCKIWGYDTDAEIGIVWVYISYLRKKLSRLKSHVKIIAKRNIGYTLEMENDKDYS